MEKLTEAELDHAIDIDQLREQYWADYRCPMSRRARLQRLALFLASALTVAGIVAVVVW